jgi:hypothetical protein
MHHGLFVAALVVPQRLVVALHLGLHQCLTESGNIAMAEDTEAAFDQPMPNAVPLGVLACEELHGRLGRRSAESSGSLASTERQSGVDLL